MTDAPCSFPDRLSALASLLRPTSLVPRRRFNKNKLVRWERRNADYSRVKAFEYKVHVTVHENEDDKEGEKTIVWAPLEILMGIKGLDYDAVKEMIVWSKGDRAPMHEDEDDGLACADQCRQQLHLNAR